MKWSFWGPGLGSVLALFLCTAGCTPSNNVPAGAPEMLTFSVIDPSGAPIDLSTSAGTSVPPLSHFLATFDRLLDPAALETVDSDGGIEANQGVALASWSGAIPIGMTAVYTPDGYKMFSLVYPPGPSINAKGTLGLPCESSVMVMLDPNKVRSHDQKTPFVLAKDASVSMSLTIVTAPLAVAIAVPPPMPIDSGADDAGDAGDDGGAGATFLPPVAATFVVLVTFNDVPSAATAGLIAVTDANGADVGAIVTPDGADPATLDVSPPATGWPAGATITVVVPAAAADNFGHALGADSSATFAVTP